MAAAVFNKLCKSGRPQRWYQQKTTQMKICGRQSLGKQDQMTKMMVQEYLPTVEQSSSCRSRFQHLLNVYGHVSQNLFFCPLSCGCANLFRIGLIVSCIQSAAGSADSGSKLQSDSLPRKKRVYSDVNLPTNSASLQNEGAALKKSRPQASFNQSSASGGLQKSELNPRQKALRDGTLRVVTNPVQQNMASDAAAMGPPLGGGASRTNSVQPVLTPSLAHLAGVATPTGAAKAIASFVPPGTSTNSGGLSPWLLAEVQKLPHPQGQQPNPTGSPIVWAQGLAPTPPAAPGNPTVNPTSYIAAWMIPNNSSAGNSDDKSHQMSQPQGNPTT
eukprot:m.302548 g.302548  ORF g.302548 m.302548 type:complete len:330 (+) comp20144_c0_seq23:363-1352(+)